MPQGGPCSASPVEAAVAVETVRVFHGACDICEGEQSVVWQHSSGGTGAGSFDGDMSPVWMLLVTAVAAGPERAELNSSGSAAAAGGG